MPARADSPMICSHRPPRRSAIGACALACILAAALASASEDQTVPADAQLPIYFKVLTYDRTLWDAPEPPLRIGLLHRLDSEESRLNLEAMITSLERSAHRTVNEVPFEYVTLTWSQPEDLARQLTGAGLDVLYVTAGHHDVLEQVSDHTRTHGVLSLAGAADDVGAGLSVGLRLEDGRPRLVVDLTALSAEGHQLDARVLRLCTVVAR